MTPRFLASAIHPPTSKRKFLFVLNYVLYADESGHSEDPELYYAGMAGFIAPAGVWEVFDERWREHMRIAEFKKPFHMKDFAHKEGQFECWKESKYEPIRKLFYGRLLDIVVETKATPVGVVVSLKDFGSLTEAQRISFKNPYYIGFQTCTHGAAIEAVFEEPGEKVAMVYSYNGKFGTNNGGSAEQLWYAIKGAYDFRDRMGTYASSTPAEFAALQAADLFAYELCHEFENQIKRPSDGMRYGLRRILDMVGIPLPRIILFDRKELLRLIKESHFPDQTGIEELGVDQQLNAMRGMTKWMYERGGVSFAASDSQI